MVLNFPELTLDLCPSPNKPSSFPNFLTQFLYTDVIKFNNDFDMAMVNDYIQRLDDEVMKIQAFQRELPLSFLLINHVTKKLKEVAKEFEKKTWMSSAQLWSSTNEENENEQPHKGAELSFHEPDVFNLSLVPPNVIDEPGSRKGDEMSGLFSSVLCTKLDKMGRPGNKVPYEVSRKRRRCWSPELHRRFVDALEKLGGSQVATPKQIRDLMQVDGLTNDEVKSHLQKYRLHVQKLPAASTTSRLSSDQHDIDELELGCSTMDLQHSSSPEGPFQMGRSKKCKSSSVEEDDEEKSDGHSWKSHNQM